MSDLVKTTGRGIWGLVSIFRGGETHGFLKVNVSGFGLFVLHSVTFTAKDAEDLRRACPPTRWRSTGRRVRKESCIAPS